MDNTTLLYLLGAFVLGAIMAWITGRRGPQREAESAQVMAESLRRSLQECERKATKLERQMREDREELERLSSENRALIERLTESERALGTTGAEAARLTMELEQCHAAGKLLEAELGHTRGALAQARSRAADLSEELARAQQAAAEAEAAAAAQRPLPEEEAALATAEHFALDERLTELEHELAVARASAERLIEKEAIIAAELLLQRKEYDSLLAEGDDAIVAALAARDRALANAEAELDFMRRDLSMLSEVGATIATTLERRNQEYEMLLARMADLELSAAPGGLLEMSPIGELSVAGEATPEALAEPPDLETALAARGAELDELRGQYEALRDELDDLIRAKAELEGKVAERTKEATDLRNRLAQAQKELQVLTGSNEDLLGQVKGQHARLSVIAGRISRFNQELRAVIGGGDVPVQGTNGQPVDATQAAAETAEAGIDRLAATVAATVAAFRRQEEVLAAGSAQLASAEEQLGALANTRADIEAKLEEKAKTLADVEVELVTLRRAFGTRNQEFDLLGNKVTALESDLSGAVEARSQIEDRVRSIAAELAGLATEYGDARERTTAATATAGTEPAPAPAEGEGAAPAPEIKLPAIDLLSANAARVAALLREKVSALRDVTARATDLQTYLVTLGGDKMGLEANLDDARQRIAVLESDLSDRNRDLETLNAQIGVLQSDVTNAARVRERFEIGIRDLVGHMQRVAAQYDNGGHGTVTAAEQESSAEPDALIEQVTNGAAVLAALLSRKHEALEESRGRIAAIEEQLSIRGRDMQALEATLDQKEQTLGVLEANVTQVENELTARIAELDALIRKASALETQLTEAQQEKAALSEQVATLMSQLEESNRQLTDVQREFSHAREANQALEGQMVKVNAELNALSSAIEADDADRMREAAAQAVKAGLATNSVSAIVSSIRQKTESLRQAQVETAALQHQFDELAAARTELERELNARRDALAVLSREAETVQAEKNSLVDNLSLRAGELQDLQLRYSDLQGQYAQIAAERDSIQRQLTTREAELAELKVRLADMASWQEKTPAVAALGQSLANMSEAKLVAANASVAAHAMPYLVNEPQALTNIKGVGPVFAQRLYKNGVGTYWEVAVLTDDELTRHLQLNDLQLLHVDLASMRGAAKRLAEESHTVGAIWEGEPPDDFEPIKGIGKVYEQRLYDAGIRTYAALAALTPEQLAEICPAQRPLKPDYASWIEQARQYLQKQGQ